MIRRRKRSNRLIRWRGEYPDGRKPGIKEDKPSKIMDACDPITSSDYFERISPDHWEELCQNRIHKQRPKRYLWTLDQNGRGSCGAECVDHAAHASERRQDPKGPGVLTNPWGRYRITSGGTDRGSVIRDNVEHCLKYGRYPEELHPRSLGWRAEPSAEAKRVAKLLTLREYFYCEYVNDFVSAILQGFEGVFGYIGHAISACQLVSRYTLKYKNSWGNWGQNGFGTIALKDIYTPYGMFVFKSVSILDPNEWTPQYDQGNLALAVESFMGDMYDYERSGQRGARGIWGGNRSKIREDLYHQNLVEYNVVA